MWKPYFTFLTKSRSKYVKQIPISFINKFWSDGALWKYINLSYLYVLVFLKSMLSISKQVHWIPHPLFSSLINCWQLYEKIWQQSTCCFFSKALDIFDWFHMKFVTVDLFYMKPCWWESNNSLNLKFILFFTKIWNNLSLAD